MAAVDRPVALPEAHIEHELPGRLRLRIPSRRGNRGYFVGASQRIAGLTGVRRVQANPLTGGLLVEHAVGTAAVADFARGHGLFDVRPRATPPARAMVPAGAPPALPDPMSVAALGLAGAGVVQLARDQALGSASESLWNAFTAKAVLRQPVLAAGLTGLGLLQLARGPVLGSAVSLFLYALSARRLARGQASDSST